MIEALREDKNFGDAVAARTDNGSVMAAGASIGFGRGFRPRALWIA